MRLRGPATQPVYRTAAPELRNPPPPPSAARGARPGSRAPSRSTRAAQNRAALLSASSFPKRALPPSGCWQCGPPGPGAACTAGPGGAPSGGSALAGGPALPAPFLAQTGRGPATSGPTGFCPVPAAAAGEGEQGPSLNRAPAPFRAGQGGCAPRRTRRRPWEAAAPGSSRRRAPWVQAAGGRRSNRRGPGSAKAAPTLVGLGATNSRRRRVKPTGKVVRVGASRRDTPRAGGPVRRAAKGHRWRGPDRSATRADPTRLGQGHTLHSARGASFLFTFSYHRQNKARHWKTPP